MNYALIALAMTAGAFTGVVFGLLDVPMPAPPELPGLLGIVGVYLGYKLTEHLDVGIDLLAALGID
jgi:XapX domain-containing protein